MTRQQRLDLLTALVRRERGDPALSVTDADELVGDLGLESSEVVWVVSELERAWGVTIPDQEVLGTTRVGELLDVVERLAGGVE